MDDDNGFDLRSWCYYDQPIRSNAGLQLIPTYNATEREAKNLLSNAQFLRRSYGVPQDVISTDYTRDVFMPQSNKILQALPMNYSYPNYTGLTEAPVAQTSQMLLPPELSIKDTPAPHQIDEFSARNEPPSKKISQGKSCKSSKPKKPKKVTAPEGEASNGLIGRKRVARKPTEVVIHGIDLDVSIIPAPVCTCTGNPQQCYRWGAGGWQSACCTTSISSFPLPMSTKRRGARIAGRKMSQGAFKKVLEKLIGEGYNFSNPIDLKTYWAKHGTNKFVTIR